MLTKFSNLKLCSQTTKNVFNPFSTNVTLLYLLKASENGRFSDNYRGYRIGSLVENGLRSKVKKNLRSPLEINAYFLWKKIIYNVILKLFQEMFQGIL